MFNKLNQFAESVLQRWELWTGKKPKDKDVQILAAKPPKTPNRNGKGGGK